MIRVSKWKRPNGYWYVRYWVDDRKIDESARTKSETTAEAYCVRREIEISTGFGPINHADTGELIPVYLESMPPKTTRKHKHEVRRVLSCLLRLCGRKQRSGRYRLQTQQVSPELITATSADGPA